jgi:hypothetical protein
MPLRSWIRLLEPIFIVLMVLAIFVAWRADRRDRAQLAAELATTKQLLAAADARQHDRDARLAETLTALAAQKRTVVTPAQIVRELPREIGLPSPIVLQSADANSSVPNQTDKQPTGNATPVHKANQSESQAVIPAEDLKPLFDFTIDCKACQAKLTAAQADLTDEKTKTAALTKERDQALQIARGGSPFRRIARAAKWFLIGAAAGAIAAKSVH